MASADKRLLAAIEREETLAEDGQLVEDRIKAIRLYRGDNTNPAEEGRSQFVARDVYDVVETVKPQLLKLFLSGDQVVRFEPTGPEDVEQANLETEYINYLALQKNDAFRVLDGWIHDGLVQKNGYVWAQWEDAETIDRESYAGLSDDELALLLQDESIEVESHETDERGHSLTIARTNRSGRVRVVNVAPENVRVSHTHTEVSLAECDFVQVRLKKTLSELRLEGHDVPDTLTDEGDDDSEDEIRREGRIRDDDGADPAMREVLVRYTWIRTALHSGGKRAELRFVVVVGKTILEDKPADLIELIAWSSKALPHQHVGLSVVDETEDIQSAKTAMTRGALDNVYLSLNGRHAIDTEKVNLDDLLVSRPGGIVRVNGDPVSAIMPLTSVPTQSIALQAIEYFDQVRESRTGITRYTSGLDPNALNKMLDVHTPVPMADGSSKLLRDIVDGDRIIGSDGRAVSVLKAHTIHDPERAYRMVFASGEEIIAGGEHLWTVQTQTDRDDLKRTRTINTDELFARKQKFAENIYIPRVQRPDFDGASALPLDPYILGYWLGDGHGWSPRITTMDEPVVERFREWAAGNGCELIADEQQNSGKATTWYIKGALYRVLRDLDLMRRNSDDDYEVIGKHIPSAYLRASYNDRLELLRGLMDADGCHHSRSLCIFSQKTGRLADDVFRLVESLGGWPSVNRVNPGDCGKEGVEYTNITFSLADCPFWLPRKAQKWCAPMANVKTQPIVLIEPVAIRPMRCLTVDAADGLFCVGNRFTVTHNTATGIMQLQAASMQRVELIGRRLAEAVKTLFLTIHALTLKHGRKAEMIRLSNRWVAVDPSSWKRRMDVTISVGLGTGNRQEQSMFLMQMLQLALGPGLQMGLTDPSKLYAMLSRLTNNAGFKSTEEFWTDPSGQPPKQQPPDPKLMIEQAKLQQAQQEMQAEAQAEATKLQQAQQEAVMRAEVEMQKARLEADTRIQIERERIASQERIAAHKLLAGAQRQQNTEFR